MMRLKEFEPGATMDRSLIIAVNRLARRHPVKLFSKVSNIDQRAALTGRHVLVITDPTVGTHR
jgi:hypothetical protein